MGARNISSAGLARVFARVTSTPRFNTNFLVHAYHAIGLPACISVRTYTLDCHSKFTNLSIFSGVQEHLDRKLLERQALETGICPVREDLYTQAFGTHSRLRGVQFSAAFEASVCCGSLWYPLWSSVVPRRRQGEPNNSIPATW